MNSHIRLANNKLFIKRDHVREEETIERENFDMRIHEIFITNVIYLS